MENKNKTVLILMENYLPGYKAGGPLSSIINLIDGLSTEYNFKVLASDRDFGDTQVYPNITTNVWTKKDNYEMCYLASGKRKIFNVIKLANKANADILYVQSFFSPVFSIAIVVATKFGFVKAPNLIIAPRGEAFEGALKIKPLKKNLYRKFAKILGLFKKVRWHASTELEKKAINTNFKIPEEHIYVALNMPKKRTSVPIPVLEESASNVLKLTYVSRISPIKNIGFTLDVLKEVSADVQYDIYGPIEDKALWKECLMKISQLPGNITVEYKGTIPKHEVGPTFAKYDLMFLPTFTENYGHAIVESLLVGTPVLISNNTPWKKLEQKDLGWDISLEDKKAYVQAIEKTSKLSADEKKQKRVRIVKEFGDILYDSETIEATRRLLQFS